MVPFIYTISNEIGRLLKKTKNIRAIHAPKRKTAHMPRSAKDALEREVPGVYRECGEMYVGQTGETFETRCKEHRR